MIDLPASSSGLDWICRHEPAKLLWIPGVQAASITAAAVGHQDALSYLRFTAQQHAIFARPLQHDISDSLFLAVSGSSSSLDRTSRQQRLQTDPKLKHLLSERQARSISVIKQAAEKGNLNALRWLHALCPHAEATLEELMLVAGQHGHLSIMQWLHSGPCAVQLSPSHATCCARHPECILWLVKQQPALVSAPSVAYVLVGTAPLAMLTQLKSDGHLGDISKNACYTLVAVTAGKQELAEWLRSQDPPCPWSPSCMQLAAKKGDLRMLMWLRAQNPPCPWDECCVTAASGSGHLHVLQWLRAQKPPCPWDSSCSEAAARRGDLRTLKWLQAQDPPCPMDAVTFAAACAGNAVNVAEWLCLNRCSIHSSAAYSAAAANGSAAVLEWLHSKRLVPSGPIPVKFIRYFFGQHYWHADFMTPPTISRPLLMFLGDIGCQLNPPYSQQMLQARKAYCVFHGLMRWCRKAVADPGKGAHRAFDCFASDASGQQLLVLMSMLPPELIAKIAVMAKLQHDMLV